MKKILLVSLLSGVLGVGLSKLSNFELPDFISVLKPTLVYEGVLSKVEVERIDNRYWGQVVCTFENGKTIRIQEQYIDGTLLPTKMKVRLYEGINKYYFVIVEE